MSKKKGARPPLEAGLLRAMQALDQQVAREMQRSPEERDRLGVRKWKPYRTRVERVAALIIEAIGANEVELDSLLILVQALPKALYILADELGSETLGEVRSEYCRAAFEHAARDSERGIASLRTEEPREEPV